MRERRGAELSGDVTHGGEPLHASGSPREEKRGDRFEASSRECLFSAPSSPSSPRNDRRRAPRVPVSYVEQDPKFFSNMTVRETLTLDARLLGGDDADVDAVLRRLGLTACADTLVGGDTGGVAVRGVSAANAAGWLSRARRSGCVFRGVVRVWDRDPIRQRRRRRTHERARTRTTAGLGRRRFGG